MNQQVEKAFNRIKVLTELQGISNDEGQVRQYLRQQLSQNLDQVDVFGLGNVFGIKKAKNELAPTVMIAAHMDEVGFIISQIHENGTFSVVPVGGWNPYAVSAQRYTLMTEKGNYPVISGAVSPHLLRGKETPTIKPEDVRFDAGFTSSKEAEEYGVQPGDSIVPLSETIWAANKKAIISKAIDNRYGCAVILDALEAIKDRDLDYHLVIGATVQEEVGLRGIRGAVHKYQPDILIAVDCSPAGDSEGDKKAQGQLGQGFLLRMQDPGMMTQKGLVRFIRQTAKDQNIPYQHYFSKGGTDATAGHTMNEGIPSAVIGMTARYIHGHQALYRIDDYLAAQKMVISLLQALTKDSIEGILTYDVPQEN